MKYTLVSQNLKTEKNNNFKYCLKFGLVYSFYGISTFLGYLIPKLFSKKNSSGTI